MAWAETPRDVIPASAATKAAASAAELFADHPDPGVHSAAELLLRRWGLDRPDAKAPTSGRGADGGRRWMLGPNGHTFVVLPGPDEFVMGSPVSEPDRFSYEDRHRQRIDRSLAVATTEATVEQYQAWNPGYQPDSRYTREPGCPAGGVSWFEAARYCNWLSEQAGLPREQWCYPEPVEPGASLAPDAFDRAGFRLPTEAEWEFFCRAGTETRRPFGDSQALLDRYARTWLNSEGLSGPAGRFLPNEFGLFDTLGSLWEWCQDGPPGSYGATDDGLYPLYPTAVDDRPAPDRVCAMPASQSDWRILRGGVFDRSPSMARSSHRDVMPASAASYTAGFRVVCTIPHGGNRR